MADVKIIHPGTGNIAEVPESSLAHHYRSGWTLLAEEPPQEPERVPEPMTEAQAARARAARSRSAKAASSEER